jgi:hypothetical protein
VVKGKKGGHGRERERGRAESCTDPHVDVRA